MLHGDQVRANERNVIDLLEHANYARMVDARNHDREKVCEQRRLLLKVERKGLVIAITLSLASLISISYWRIDLHFNIRYSHNDVLELVVFPCIRRPLDHSKSSVVL